MRRRGFLTIPAVFLVGLMTAALAVVAAAGVADVRRTRALVADAQLRQLLLAAGADAAARASGWTQPELDSWSFSVPTELAGYAVKVRAAPGAAGSVEVTLTAEGEGHRATQRMAWKRAATGWQLASVTCDAG